MIDHIFTFATFISTTMQQIFRKWALRLRGINLGRGVIIGSKVKIGKGVIIGALVKIGDRANISGNVILGSKVEIQKDVEITGNVEIGAASNIGPYSFISTMPTGKLRIGKRVMVNSFNILGAGKEVLIEDDCIFAAFVHITDSSHQFENISSSPRHDPALSEPVSIGEGSWLGSAVKVLKGVVVHKGCVIGAGAVVTRTLPPFSISVGIPAKVVRYRE